MPISVSINWCLKICAAEDHSAQLVEIADTLGNPPFGRLHRLPAFVFCLFTFWVVRQHGTASAQHTRPKGDLQADRRLTNWDRRSSSLHFFVLFSRLVPSRQLVSMLSLKL
ncbi:hypothetical protein H5410_051592 [Solanum commersonii]|uniref:Uncharacterized protein n=1 Tax=Solanum commersonii TaxID=4109 RepID=A0A9J5X0I8_SOLCO|nr:hypothetical protein H5410_051592 [Solanum commersonii]